MLTIIWAALSSLLKASRKIEITMSANLSTAPIELALIGAQNQIVVEGLQKRFILHTIFAEADPFAALAKVGGGVRGAVGNGMSGLTRRHIELMPKLEICAIHGVGLETSDLFAIRERGIVLTTTPVLFDDVADLAIALALGCCRQIARADRFVRAKRWGNERLPFGRKLSGMRAGVIGLGRIGTEVARRLEGFKCQIGYADPLQRDVPYQRFETARALAENSDVLFLCAAGGPKGSPPLVGRDMFEALGPRGIFVNISRGWLVDEPALVAALSSGSLGAAGLDVFFDEPLVPNSLLALDNVVLTPHIASSTEETMDAMGRCVIDNLTSWFDGKGALTAVT